MAVIRGRLGTGGNGRNPLGGNVVHALYRGALGNRDKCRIIADID